MVFKSRFLFVLFAALIFMPMCASAAPPETELQKEADSYGFAPHKALYEIKLAGTKPGSQIVDISGEMMYEWQPTCDAWVSNHRFNLNYDYADSPVMRVSSDFSTYEPFDGKSINFSSERRRDGQAFEELRGQATVGDSDEDLAAIYSLPRGLEYDLPEGAVLISHTLNVLKAMKAGQKFYKATVFDGSDEDGPVEINAFIGQPVDVSKDFTASKEMDVSLLKSPAHRIRLAFFPLNDPKEYSDYEMDITFHENGVISDMYIEYGDFSVTQKLIGLEKLTPPSCKAKNEPGTKN